MLSAFGPSLPLVSFILVFVECTLLASEFPFRYYEKMFLKAPPSRLLNRSACPPLSCFSISWLYLS